jgi:beta-1,4-N-acetylglucosaminyltransferase
VSCSPDRFRRKLIDTASLKIGIRKNVKRAVKLLEATGVPKSTVQLGFVALAFLTLSWLAWRGWIPSMAYMVFGALIWRSYPSRNNNSQSFRAKKDGETCSTAVFLGSGKFQYSTSEQTLIDIGLASHDAGGHTGEAIQLLSALDTTRYTPRTYIFCTGDNISLTKATSFENDLIRKSPKDVSSGKTSAESPFSYRLVELPRARRVAQSYFSAIGTTTYSILVTLWRLAVEPIVKGDLKQIPDLLIVNGPGTCVVVVLVYKLLKVSRCIVRVTIRHRSNP